MLCKRKMLWKISQKSVKNQWPIQRFFGNTVFGKKFGGGSQKDKIVIFEELFSVIYTYRLMDVIGRGYLLQENETVMYLSFALDIVLGENSFKVL